MTSSWLRGFVNLRLGASYIKSPLYKSGGNGHCVSGDIMDLVCQVISQDHEIKELCVFMGKSHSW